MYHVKMTAHIYNIWSLAYRTHSLVLVRHCYDLFCGLFSSNDLLSSIYLSKSSVRLSGLHLELEKGYNDRDTVRIQSGYSQDTVWIQ